MKIYDGTSKPYPNGTMLLFIPMHDNIQYDAEYRHKVIYNHERYLGDEEAISIHGLQDIDMITTLKTQQNISIRMLLRSIPATQDMSHSQLFQLAETNAKREAIVVIHQKEDRELVQARLLTLQNDILAQLATGEANRIFISEIEGITFRPLTKTKGGQIIQLQPTSQSNIDHIQHTKSILSSPLKKRPYAPRSSNPHQSGQNSGNHTHPTGNRTNPPTGLNYATAAQQHLNGNSQQQQNAVRNHHIQQNNTFNPTNSSNISIASQTKIDAYPEEINQRFLQIEEEIQEQKLWNTEQREWNEDMIMRVNYIEDTTTSTDNKVDSILNKLDSWEERSAPYPHLQDNSGDMSG
jgi:hypothetical protein